MSNTDNAVMGNGQREIYDSAVDLFWEKGYFGTSMRELATAVGIQLSSLYHHNRSKQDFLIRIMERTMQDLTAAVREAVEAAEGVRDQLAAAVRAHVLCYLFPGPGERDECLAVRVDTLAEPPGRISAWPLHSPRRRLRRHTMQRSRRLPPSRVTPAIQRQSAR